MPTKIIIPQAILPISHPYLVNKYTNIYFVIIQNAEKRSANLTKKEIKSLLGYTERHHIIPKCMGGIDDKSNLAILTAREHFIAH